MKQHYTETYKRQIVKRYLKGESVIATLELVDSICDMALTYTDSEISKISWTDFVSGLDEETCSELITYLKERQLYVNAPVHEKEDD